MTLARATRCRRRRRTAAAAALFGIVLLLAPLVALALVVAIVVWVRLGRRARVAAAAALAHHPALGRSPVRIRVARASRTLELVALGHTNDAAPFALRTPVAGWATLRWALAPRLHPPIHIDPPSRSAA